jgi:hypothetical protein
MASIDHAAGRWFRVAGLLVGALALISLAGGCIASDSGAPASHASPFPGGSGATPGPTPIATTVSGWSAVQLHAGARENVLASRLSAGAPGLLAAGERVCHFAPGASEPTVCLGQLWASTSGDDWQLVRDPDLEVSTVMTTSGPEPGLIDLAANEHVAVLVGWAMDARGGVGVWTVGADLDVERVATGDVFDDAARPQAIAATSNGFVIVGSLLAPGRPVAAAWWSPDGLAWTRAEDGPWSAVGAYIDTGEEPGHGGMLAATGYPDGVAAVGQTCDDTGFFCSTALWQSVDGRAWELRGTAGDVGSVARTVTWTGEELVGFGGDAEDNGFAVDWNGRITELEGWPACWAATTSETGTAVACWRGGQGLPPIGAWRNDGLAELHQVVRPGSFIRAADVLAVGPVLLSIASLETAGGFEVVVLRGPLDPVE